MQTAIVVRRSRGVAAAFVVLAATIMIASTHGMNATCDEVAHLPAGYTYLAWGDFRLNPEHPPLTKALAAVPLVLFDHVAATQESGPWQRALLQPKQQWRFGHDFLYSTPGNDADRLRAHTRLPMVAAAVLLGVLLSSWTREIWGEVPAAAAVVAWALRPNLLRLLGRATLVDTIGYSMFVYDLPSW